MAKDKPIDEGARILKILKSWQEGADFKNFIHILAVADLLDINLMNIENL